MQILNLFYDVLDEDCNFITMLYFISLVNVNVYYIICMYIYMFICIYVYVYMCMCMWVIYLYFIRDYIRFLLCLIKVSYIYMMIKTII